MSSLRRRNPRRCTVTSNTTTEDTNNHDDVDDDDDIDDISNNDNDEQSQESSSSSSAVVQDEESSSSSEEEEQLEPEKPVRRRNRRQQTKTQTTSTSTRASSRSTRFQRSMEEPKDSINDLFVDSSGNNDDHENKNVSSSSPRKKSPAKRHLSARKIVRTEVQVDSSSSNSDDDDHDSSSSSDDDEEHKEKYDEEVMSVDEEEGVDHDEEEEEDEEEQEVLKIQRIVASRSEPRKEWKKICRGINTSEVEYGSRWFQPQEHDDNHDGENENNDNINDGDTFEERFLVKWADLSYMHCSWETKDDLMDQCDNAKTYLTSFFRKSDNGLLFTADERCDGDYFDPAFVQVDRILEIYLPDEEDGTMMQMQTQTSSKKSKEAKDDDVVVEEDDPIETFGIILDRANPDFESGTGRQLLIKWKNTPYSNMSYEFERDLILNDIEYLEPLKAFEARRKKPTKSEVSKTFKLAKAEENRLADLFSDEDGDDKKDARVKAFQEELESKMFPNGGQLRDYQAEGVTWLAMNFMFDRSSILCDEMGLGKTLQTAAFIDFVDKKMHRRGPFLIVAPLSTIPHWQREFANWTDLNTIVYHGSARDRELIREFEIAYECDRPKNGVAFNQSFLRKCMPKSKSAQERIWMAQVVITTPEMLTTEDFVELTYVDWQVLVVDEAHRLKNHNSKLANNLRDSRFQICHTLLLTGTPIQNNMTELWTLLNFIDPYNFGDMDEFLERYGEVKSKERVDELHEKIRPYILRRLKEDVEKSVPPKEETLIEVELTVLQKQYYRALYEKNVHFLHKNKTKAIDGPSLNNLAMQLRKCCNHPFLLNGVEEEVRAQEGDKLSEGDFLVKASGKLVLLDKLLPRLRDDGHRVLIFSQFKIMLDILEDYLADREIKFERIDGSITGNKRQMAIDRFQSPAVEGKEAPLVMLLSTRAGGVGINLTAADTCIIFDSDWNPQNDLQAQARCHRIGQTKNVKVYRLLSRKTYEMQMFHMSSLKMGLDQAVLQGIESSGSSGEDAMTKEEVERLLRHGAYDIFNEEKAGSADAESNDFVQQDLDSILERRSKTVVHENTGSSSSAAGGTFSKASFRAPKTPASGQGKAQTDEVDIDDPEFWTKMVGEAKTVDNNTIMTGMKRKRTKAEYSETAYDSKLNLLSDGCASSLDSGSESDEWSVQDAGARSPDSDVELLEAPPSKKPAKKKERTKWGGSGSNQWEKKDAEALLKGLQMYGYGNIPWDVFAEKASLDIGRYGDAEEVKRMCWSMILFILRDGADDDANSAKKRAARKAEKRLEAGEKEGVSTSTTETGGILGRSDLNALANQDDLRELRDGAFKKLVSSNVSWLKEVVEDAADYARIHVPRPRHVIESALQSHDSPGAPAPHSLEALFAASLWPQLRIRGWTADTVSEGELSGTRRFVYSGKEYRSPRAVCRAIPDIHPELSRTVDSILVLSAGAQPKSQDETATVQGVASLDLDSITPSSLSSFMDSFAPLQLLVDRAKDRKMKWHRKCLNTCSYLSVAHNLVKRAEDMAGSTSINSKIASLLCLNKRIALPHPSWSSRHDAVLIRAIVKHGWIELDSCCRAITADSSIKWGAPFDDGESTNAASGGRKKEPDLDLLRESARHAADFLNAERDMIENLKEFNAAPIVRSYGLVKSTEAVVESTDETDVLLSTSTKWKVDDSLLLQNVTGRAKKGSAGNDRDESNTEGEVDLPTKKELLKRAKTVLSRGSISSDQSTEIAASAAANPIEHEYAALDQSNPCNMLLSEMLRCLLKMSFSKKDAKYLCSNAQAEARRLCEQVKNRGTENESKVRELMKIVEHIRLVGRTMATNPRPAKNVLRVLLGDPPIVAKNGLASLFPLVETMELQIAVVDGGGGAQSNSVMKQASGKGSKASKKGEASVGERAISRAIAEGVEKNKEAHGKFSGSSDPSLLELSGSETLVLSVLCNLGLPVWSDEHALELISNYEDTDSDMHAGIGNVITWRGVAETIMAGAEAWAQQAAARLERSRSMTITASNREKRLADIADVEREYASKRHAFALAKNDVANPLKFAKKCIMLLEAVRRKMGPVDTKRGSTAKQIKAFNKSENNLGPRVLSWMASEISRWAGSLGIVDRTQRPICSTTASTVLVGEDGVTLFAVMSKKGCRSVFGQIAQLTRSRSIFNANNESEVRELVSRATRQSRIAQDAWDDKPAWWNQGGISVHDYDLLDGLLFHGYHFYRHIFSSSDSFTQGKENYQEQVGTTDDGDDEVQLTKKAIQLRVNQLTRELHVEALRIVDSKRRHSGDSEAQDGGSNVAAAPSHVPVQTGIQAFFSPSKPLPLDSKEPGSKVFDLCDARKVFDLCDSSDEEVVARPQRNSEALFVEPSSHVEVLDVDQSEVKIVPQPPIKDPAVAKRQDCPSGSSESIDAGSSENKAKTTAGNEPAKHSPNSEIEVVEAPEEETPEKKAESTSGNEPAKQSPDSGIEVVEPPGEETAKPNKKEEGVTSKRKDCPSDADSETGSPEKKSKISEI